MENIFISYRREDTEDLAGRIYDVLEHSFGRAKIFKDVDSIQPGTNFRVILNQAISRSDVMLVIIGQHWLSVTDAQGHRRLDAPDDFVRLEIEAGLQRNMFVIPVLVKGATMPPRASLPPSIADLADRQGFELRSDPHFRRDIEQLATIIRNAPAAPRQRSAPPTPQPTNESFAQPRPPAPPLYQAPSRYVVPPSVTPQSSAPYAATERKQPAPAANAQLGRNVLFAGLAALVVFGAIFFFNHHTGSSQPPGTGGTQQPGANHTTPTTAKCMKIGVLLPESATSARWEGKDHPLLQAAIQQYLPGATVDFSNANGDSDVQQSQAETDLSNGDCILILAPHDSAKAAAIVDEAKSKNVPVIAYDRLIKDASLNFYVSFDNVSVGVAQGTYIKQHYAKYISAGHNHIAFINGSPNDDNATLFAQGVHSVVDQLIAAGTLKKVYEQFTPNWDNSTAQTEMEGALSDQNNNIQIAYVANDGMAGTVIAALQSQALNGKVLVTGQDATVAGLQQILLGNQSMTVYKPIVNEANAAAQLAAALSKGQDTTSIANKQTANSGVQTPSVLLPVTTVDITNIASTVLKDNFVSKSDICQGVPTGAGGIC